MCSDRSSGYIRSAAAAKMLHIYNRAAASAKMLYVRDDVSLYTIPYDR